MQCKHFKETIELIAAKSFVSLKPVLKKTKKQFVSQL